MFLGSDDCTVRVWEVSTGRVMRCYKFQHPIQHLKINPKYPCFSVIVDNSVIIVGESLLGNIEEFQNFLEIPVPVNDDPLKKVRLFHNSSILHTPFFFFLFFFT